jgi:hypothetical protein
MKLIKAQRHFSTAKLYERGGGRERESEREKEMEREE